MKELSKKNRAFTIVEVLIALIFVGLIAFVAIRLIGSDSEKSTTDESTTTILEAEIESSDDLEKLEDELNNASFDDIDTSELDEIEEELL